ncbi:MAG TPA: C39 family peptidase, partial [Vicinamibacterales bacterium]
MNITPAAAAWIAAAVWFAAAPAAAQTASVPRPGVLLDVPYVPQSELLCGGAAAAMVMRYWGARTVSAASFAPLVDRAAHGIAVTSLVDDLRRRSWSVVAGSGTDADVTRELTRGHPVIALVAAGRGRLHYVVIVAWTPDRIVLHDPARAPFRTVAPRRFDAEWRASNRWMLILLPSAALERTLHSDDREDPPTPAAPVDDPGDPCAPDVSSAIRAAQAGDADSATQTLVRAAAACPRSAAVWRELAGADAAASQWHEAADHARRALVLDSHDEQAWRVLAAAEYVQRHDRAALDAWNHLGEPRLDLVNVQGLTRTRYAIAADAIGIDPGMPITPDALALAERRLRDVPSLSSATVGYHPVENERAQVDAAIVERDAAPLNYPAWIAMGVEAAAERRVTASFASPTGGGELASVAWRWWTGRPMLSASFAAPAPASLGGTWRLDVSRETQSFGPSAFQQTRVHAGFAAGKWISTTLKLDGGVSLEHWIDGPHMAALSAR